MKFINFDKNARRRARKEARKRRKEKERLQTEAFEVIKANDKVVSSMEEVDFSDLFLPFITLYNNPVDYPGKFVARVFDLDKPTNCCCIYESREQAKEDAAKAGFEDIIPRMPHDDIHIVEAYVWGPEYK